MRHKDLHSALWIAAATVSVTLGGCAFQHGGGDTLASLPDSAYGSGKFARELRAAGEYPLYLLGSDSPRVAYRMVSLGAWGGASVARLEQRDDAWILVLKATDNGEKRRLLADSANVSRAQADSLLAVVQRSNYWTRPVQTCRSTGIDGHHIVLEARVEGKYFTIHCWVPKENEAPAVIASMRAFAELSEAVFPTPPNRAP
jgi:hypothetical protein